MHAKKTGAKKTSKKQPRSRPPGDRDGEVAGISVVDPPPADGGKVRDPGKDPKVGTVR